VKIDAKMIQSPVKTWQRVVAINFSGGLSCVFAAGANKPNAKNANRSTIVAIYPPGSSGVKRISIEGIVPRDTCACMPD